MYLINFLQSYGGGYESYDKYSGGYEQPMYKDYRNKPQYDNDGYDYKAQYSSDGYGYKAQYGSDGYGYKAQYGNNGYGYKPHYTPSYDEYTYDDDHYGGGYKVNSASTFNSNL